MSPLVIEAYPPRPTGGQHVGTGPNGVKITHITGLTAICETHRSQHKNKQVAMAMIEYGLAELGIEL